MKNSVLLLLALGVGLPVHAADQKLTKQQIDAAFAKTSKERHDFMNKAKKKYEAQFVSLKKQQTNELNKLRIHDKNEEESAKLIDQIHDKYGQLEQKIWDKMWNEHTQQIAKKYNVPENVAQHFLLPFSMPLIKKMAIAADKHDKQELQRLLSQYFTIMYGANWKTLMTQRIQSEIEGTPYGEMLPALFVKDPNGLDLARGLSSLYFKVFYSSITEEIEDTSAQADKLLAELFGTKK